MKFDLLILRPATHRLRSLAVIIGFLFSLSLWAATPEQLETAAQNHIADLPEFQFIKEFAEAKGIRAFLFGGSASSYLRYVKLDLDREQNANLEAGRFDYSFYRIFRSTQDVDIVIDGTPEQALALSQAISSRFPYMQGNRNAWEVRLLRQDMGDKEALLGNPNFANQHTDSYSVGLVEVTNPPRGEPRVRDLKNWSSNECQFLKDVLADEIHFYFSPLHKSTRRFQQGLNPQIFSVIRILIKQFQFSLKISDENRAILQQIIAGFDPEKDLRTDYAKNWMVKSGINLLRHASDLELAFDELNRLHLANILKRLPQDRIPTSASHMTASTFLFDTNSLRSWMLMEPLRSLPVGRGNGPLASELGITELTHDTSDFTAIESIQRSPDGRPNQFITTYNGNEMRGVYTCVGKKGGKPSGFSVHYWPLPEARYGTDFIFGSGGRLPPPGQAVSDGTVVLIKNKNAFRVVPPFLSVDPKKYFQMILHDHYLPPYQSTQNLRSQTIDWPNNRDYGRFLFFRQETMRQLATDEDANREINRLMLHMIQNTTQERYSPHIRAAVEEWVLLGQLGSTELKALKAWISFYYRNGFGFGHLHLDVLNAIQRRSGDPTTRSIIEAAIQSTSAREREFGFLSIMGRSDSEIYPIVKKALFSADSKVKAMALYFFLSRLEHSAEFARILQAEGLPTSDTFLIPLTTTDASVLPQHARNPWFDLHRESLKPFEPLNNRELLHLLLARTLSQPLSAEDSQNIHRIVHQLIVSHEASPLLFIAWLDSVELNEAQMESAIDYLQFIFSTKGGAELLQSNRVVPVKDAQFLTGLATSFIATILKTLPAEKGDQLLQKIFTTRRPEFAKVLSQTLQSLQDIRYMEVAHQLAKDSSAEVRKGAYAYFLNATSGPHFDALSEYFADTDPTCQKIFQEAVERAQYRSKTISVSIDQFLVNMSFSPSQSLSHSAMRVMLKRPNHTRLFVLLMSSPSLEFVEGVTRFITNILQSNYVMADLIQIGIEHPEPRIRALSFEGLKYYRGPVSIFDQLIERGRVDPDHLVRLATSKAMTFRHPDWNQAQYFAPEDIYQPEMGVLVKPKSIVPQVEQQPPTEVPEKPAFFPTSTPKTGVLRLCLRSLSKIVRREDK